MSQASQSVSLGNLLAYGLPGLPLAALLLPLYIFLPAFYADDLGLGFTAVGAILLVARLSDVATDPLIGALSDRTATRFGRRRVWMAIGVPIVLIAAHMLFQADPGVGPGYLLVWTIAVYLGITMILLPYSAWGAELSSDYHERSRIAASREGFIVVGTLVAAGVPSVIGADRGAALASISWALWVVLPVSIFVALRAVPEGGYFWGASAGWRRSTADLWENKPFRRLVAAYLLNGIANGLPASLFLLYVAHVIERPDWSGLLLLVYFACGVAAIPAWLRLSAHFGKHIVWTGAMIWACAAFACVPLLGAGDQWWFLLICIATGFGLGADLTLPASMQADVVDIDTLRTGRQRTGTYYAIWGMATKLALALAVGIAFPLLDLAGFEPSATEPNEIGLTALAVLYSLVPVAFKIGAVALIFGYPITAEKQRDIRQMIQSRYARI